MAMSFQDNPANILGADSADNQFASTNVVANADGSIIERLEALKDSVASVGAAPGNFVWGIAPAGTNSTTAVVIASLAGYGDDFFNHEYFMQVIKNANSATNAPEKEVRQITDYVSSTGTFTVTAFSAAVEASDLCLIVHESVVALGRDDADNTFASTNVAANADGSILERLEYLQSEMGAAVGADLSADIAAIKAQTDEIGSAVGASISADIAAVQTAVDTNATYIDTEVAAIKSETDKIGTVSNSGGTATLGAVIGDANNVNLVTRLGSITTQTDKIGTVSNAGGTATLGGAIGAVANNPLVDRLADIQTEVDKVGTVTNTAGTATLGAVLGDFANDDLASRMADIGSNVDSTTTDNLQGKLGTDTELADRSLYDLLNGGGPAAAASAAAPANDVSLYGALRAIYNLSVPAASTGETVIDEGDYDWTADYPALLTIAPAAGAPLADVEVVLDMDKVTTGFATTYAAQTITFTVERKVDGTNWRREAVVESALAGNSADNRALKFNLGSVGVTEQVRITAVLSAENGGATETDLPYVVYYKGLAAPTITPLTATA